MLSFDVSAIDVVLLVAVLVLLLLFISQKRGHSVAEPRLNADHREKFSVESEMTAETALRKPIERQSAEGFQKCVHQFGHLRNMQKNTAVPDECFGCPMVLRCMFKNE